MLSHFFPVDECPGTHLQLFLARMKTKFPTSYDLPVVRVHILENPDGGVYRTRAGTSSFVSLVSSPGFCALWRRILKLGSTVIVCQI